ncbi:ABC transporter substrate-binding protein [Streptomyces pathocidini]|uniref:ABC transporter substrate-binding protein n=1 Tax=Streptomyces pathocidini TaxID=1650571 RepID=A0ABW7UUZ3_9ACTN|nr:ABC transporter substrate-binding protein [Streptomyces pathocidini]
MTTGGTATQGTRIYMFQSLMGIDNLKGGEFTPWLASAQEMSKDGRTLTITLDKRATWSDGKPVTAEDVVFTFDLVKKTPALNGTGISFETVEAKDDKTVVMTFEKAAFTQVPGILKQYIVPKKHWEGKNPVTFTNPKPVGSGPYTLERFNPKQVTLQLRDDYWRSDTIKVKHIQLPVVNAATEISQMMSGKQDVSGGAIANLEKLYIQKDPKKNGYFYPSYGFLSMFFNHDRPQLQNVHLRKAMSLAMDREQQIKLVTALGANPISQTGLDAETQSKWLDPAYKEPVEQDLAAAKSELKKAGYTLRGGKAVDAKGKPLALKYIEVSDFADSVQRARVIASQLMKIGVKVTVQPLAIATYNEAKAKGEFDLAASGYAYGAVPWQVYNSMLNSQFAGSADGKKPAQTNNFLRWRDDKTDRLLDEMASSGDEKKQIEATRKLEKVIVDEVPYVTLSSITAGCAWSNRNWTGWPSEKDDPYTYCAPWYDGPEFEEVLSRLKPAGS